MLDNSPVPDYIVDVAQVLIGQNLPDNSTVQKYKGMNHPLAQFSPPTAISFRGHFIYSGSFLQLTFPDEESTKLFNNAIVQLVDFYKVVAPNCTLDVVRGTQFTAKKIASGHAELEHYKTDVWFPLTQSYGFKIIRSLVSYQYEGRTFINTHINKEIRYCCTFVLALQSRNDAEILELDQSYESNNIPAAMPLTVKVEAQKRQIQKQTRTSVPPRSGIRNQGTFSFFVTLLTS